jgi:hypothetical protein
MRDRFVDLNRVGCLAWRITCAARPRPSGRSRPPTAHQVRFLMQGSRCWTSPTPTTHRRTCSSAACGSGVVRSTTSFLLRDRQPELGKGNDHRDHETQAASTSRTLVVTYSGSDAQPDADDAERGLVITRTSRLPPPATTRPAFIRLVRRCRRTAATRRAGAGLSFGDHLTAPSCKAWGRELGMISACWDV